MNKRDVFVKRRNRNTDVRVVTPSPSLKGKIAIKIIIEGVKPFWIFADNKEEGEIKKQKVIFQYAQREKKHLRVHFQL